MRLYLVQHADAKRARAHSGKLRAKQTAEVLAEHLNPARGVLVSKDLEPLADPVILKRRLDETVEDSVLVGHLPHLQKLTGHLLTSNENKLVVTFRNAGIVCLDRESGYWTIQWIITPEILPRKLVASLHKRVHA